MPLCVCACAFVCACACVCVCVCRSVFIAGREAEVTSMIFLDWTFIF